MRDVNEREISAYALMDILDGGGFNNIVLKRTLSKYNGIGVIKKNMVTEIVNGTLRNLILIDYVISIYSNIDINKIKPFIKSLLRISIYQLMFMDKIPHSAVCNEAVKLARKKNFGGLSGYVNAVLRNVSKNRENLEFPNDRLSYISVKYSYPEWIIEYFMQFLTEHEVLSVCEAGNTAPPITVCVNLNKISLENLKKVFDSEGVYWQQGDSAVLRIKGFSDLRELESFKKGFFHIMDASSIRAIDLLELNPGSNVLDICSAPGSKSFYAAYIMRNKGRILSLDINERRLELVEQGVKRLEVDIIETGLNDGTIFNEKFVGVWDYVILDAPCSGFGVLRKKPDAKYTKTIEDVNSLAILQKKMLECSWRYTKKGGKLLYSTCTISKKENQDNIKWFLDNFPYEIDREFNTLTEKNGGDGFFAACLKRI